MNDSKQATSLHEAVATGIERALRDFGADLTGCTPASLTGHIIRELRDPNLGVPDAEVAHSADVKLRGARCSACDWMVVSSTDGRADLIYLTPCREHDRGWDQP